MDTHVLILGAALIVILSFFFNRISKATNIPSVLMLMLLGFCLKFVVPFDVSSLQGEIQLEEITDVEAIVEQVDSLSEEILPSPGEISPAAPASTQAKGDNPILSLLKILGTVGVILIVLEAALDLHLERKKIRLISQAAGLALVLLIATSALIAGGLLLVLDMDLMTSLFYAVPLAVMSSAIIIPSVQILGERKKEFLIFESALSDILGIIIFYALLDFHHAAEGDNVGLTLAFKTLITLVLSVVISYGLIILFQYVKGHVKLFVMIASLLALYSLGKLLHLSSLIIILVFGLMLNNKELFFRGRLQNLIDEEAIDGILKEFKPITLETAFIVRTFFFVAFGFSIVPGQLLDVTVPIITLIVLIAIYGTRYIGLRTVFFNEIKPEIYVAPRGLITILLFYAIPLEVSTDAFAPGILLLTVLITSFVMTYGLIQDRRGPKSILDNPGKKKEGPIEMPAGDPPKGPEGTPAVSEVPPQEG